MQSLSMAFHPQTDGETERVNQEIEQFFRIFCNFQQDNWSQLLPFAEFAHNVRTHSVTSHSPFQIWYSYQPEFLPPMDFTSTLPSMEDRVKTLEQICTEVSAALAAASKIMKQKGPSVPSHTFTAGQLVQLKGTNVKTTHPKAKLAPRHHSPFKIISTSPTNSCLQLPPSWHIHPMFHNSLLTPYKETEEHGTNYKRPPPELVDNKDQHYKVENVANSKLSRNCQGIL